MKQDAVILNQKIKQLDEVQQYLKYKQILLNDPELIQLINDINHKQSQMKKALKDNDMVVYHSLKKQLNEAKIIFDENPVIQNYRQYKKDVQDIIQEIGKILYWE